LTHDDSKLAAAFRSLGLDPELRRKVVGLCREIETSLVSDGADVREKVTGPIVDALHSKDCVLRKKLVNGLLFDFYYRSKIARDLVLAPDEGLDHLFEPQTTKLALYLARQARHAIVGGAYSGDHALLLAKSIQPHGGVCHAFEPDAEQLAQLAHNAEINNLGNIRMNQSGLWSDDTSTFSLVGFDACAHVERSPDASGPIPGISIDTYSRESGIDRLDLIFLDIEGSELPALQGALSFLTRPAAQSPHIIFEVHRNYVDWSNGLANTEIVRYLRDCGYSVYSIRDYQSNVPMTGEPIEIIPADRTFLEGPPHGFNMLAVKDPGLLEDLRFRMCRDVSPKLLRHKDPRLHAPLRY
jgi:FkbM family methyltransferase